MPNSLSTIHLPALQAICLVKVEFQMRCVQQIGRTATPHYVKSEFRPY